jgi:thiol-disulfide isomerase/thioredoxin
MNVVAVGPFLFAGDRLAAIIGIGVFMIISAVLSRRVDSGIRRWSDHALIAGILAARAGHVVGHLDTFLAEPWRMLAVWEGGFSLLWGLVAVLAVTALHVRSVRMGLATGAALAASLLVWTIVGRLTVSTAGTAAPTQVMEQLDGPPMALTDTGGRPAVVNIWATWCPPCRREMPLLAEVAAARKDVSFLFLNQGESRETIERYLATGNIALDHILLDQAMAIPRHYRTPGIPVTLFLRADGTLMTTHMGAISREVLAETLARLVQSK